MTGKFVLLFIFMCIVSAKTNDEIMEKFKQFEQKEESNLAELIENIFEVIRTAKKIGCNIGLTVQSKYSFYKSYLAIL